MIYEGAIATKAILEGKNREIEWVMIDETKDDRNTRYIINLVLKNNIKLIKTTRSEIDKLTIGKTHGGIITSALERNYQSLSKLNLKKMNTIMIIDGIEDPFNLGYALRSLYAFNINTVIMKNSHLINSENIVVKSSAGASEKMNIILSDDLVADIKFLKTKDFKLSLLKRSDESEIYFNTDLTTKQIIAIGGEKRGLSKDIESLADINLYIPYSNDFRNSLNATSAIVTIAAEVQRQKLTKETK